jgi:hypothetical protein
MGKIYKLDRSGHGEVASWDADAESRAAGAAAFDDLVNRGFTMFDTSDKLASKSPLQAFDPDATEIIAVPRMVAG